MSIDLNELWEHNKGLVYRECKKYFGSTDYDDLIQESFLALCAAAETYDPDKGAFSTWACYYIRAYISRYFARNRLAPVPYRFLPCAHKYAGAQPLPGVETLMQEYGFTKEDATAARHAISVYSNTVSLQAPVKTGDGSTTVGESIADTAFQSPEETALASVRNEELRQALDRAMSKALSDTEQKILKLYYYGGYSLKDIAAATGSSYSKVNSAKQAALAKLRRQHHELDSFRDGIIRANGMKHTGVQSFNETWTSATEREALRLIELGRRYYSR